MMFTAQFKVDREKCSGCGKCLEVCPGNMVGGDVLRMKDGIPEMVDQTAFGWKGCWRCEHCMAVCPEGAISVLGISPENAPERPDPSVSDELTRLVQYRRTCRAFKDENVDPEIMDSLIQAISAVPTGGNSLSLEFSVVESRDAMRTLYDAVFPYRQTSLFENDEDMKKLGLYNAPHIFIAHKPISRRFHDGDLTELGVATAYFELLADSYGLGTVITNHAAEQIMKSKAARSLLNIPDDHTALAAVGFGYPAIEYQRGVIKKKKVYRVK